jgi:hypothetical protein
VEWVSNIVLVEKKNTDKLRVCVDFRSLNRAMPKDEYPMQIADDLINRASGNRIISFWTGLRDIIRFLWPKMTYLKLLFIVWALSIYLNG